MPKEQIEELIGKLERKYENEMRDVERGRRMKKMIMGQDMFLD